MNGSTFPAPDPTMKANTPPVSDPNYSTNISQPVVGSPRLLTLDNFEQVLPAATCCCPENPQDVSA